MSKPVYQHLVPRVYLKEFQIDNDTNKSFLYCYDFTNLHKRKIQRVGLNDRLFKEKKYYNDDRYQDPFTLEKMFATEVEPHYATIMNGIRAESNLTVQVREYLLLWTFVSHCRSQYLRWNTERVMSEIIKLQHAYEKKQLDQDEKSLLDQYIRQSSKEIQLDIFSDKEQLDKLSTLHSTTLTSKHWSILKPATGNFFLTNDNPGFSPNTIARFSAQRPFHPLMELNDTSIIFYVLSPHYCLRITPFTNDTPVEINAMNMDIKFETIDVELTEAINAGVWHTKLKLLISHSREVITRVIKNEARMKA